MKASAVIIFVDHIGDVRSSSKCPSKKRASGTTRQKAIHDKWYMIEVSKRNGLCMTSFANSEREAKQILLIQVDRNPEPVKLKSETATSKMPITIGSSER